MQRRTLILFTSLTFVLFLSNRVFAGKNSLTLASYLQQVKENHSGYMAAKQRVSAAKDRQGQGSLVFLPKISIAANSTRDEKEQIFTGAYGDRTIYHKAVVAIEENTPAGLSATVSHTQEFTSLHGVDPLIIPQNQFHMGTSTLALSQSLWRNGFGREARAERDYLDANEAATQASEKANLQSILFQAETAYWRYWLNQHTAQIEKARWQRGALLLRSMQDKFARRLIDEADLQQARAAYTARELATQIAESDVQSAALEFNRWRGGKESVVAESLPDPQISKNEIFKNNTSLVAEAQIQNKKAAAAAATISGEKLKPELNFFGSATLNHLDSQLSSSLSDLGNTEHPTLTVGIWFSMPLAFLKTQKIARAYEQTRQSYTQDEKQLHLNDQQEQIDLAQRTTNNQKHNAMAEQVLKAQRERVRAERQRYDSGHSTLMDVIQSEDDLATAEITAAGLRVQQRLLLAAQRYRGDLQ